MALSGAVSVRCGNCVLMVFRELFRVNAALRCRAAALLALRGGGQIAPLDVAAAPVALRGGGVP